MLKENDVLIRGQFDSFAEQLANDLSLNFRPSDFIIAENESEKSHESTRLTMKFTRSGNVVIEENISSPGSSCSHTYGGKFHKSLPRDFYKTKTADDIALMYGEALQKAVIENGKLADMLEKMKTHKIYMGKN